MRASSLRLSLRLPLIVGAMTLAGAWATPASAQTSSSLSKYPQCAGAPSRGDSEAAHGAYLAGKGSFDEADYATAINYFKDAYRRDCTKYELLNIIARAFELKGDRAEAIHALETYLQRAPADDPGAEAIQRRIVNLKAQLAAQSATPEPAPEPEPAPPAAPAEESAARESEAAGGHTVYPWILTGVGGAVLVSGVVLAIVGAGQRSDSFAACPDRKCLDEQAQVSAQELNNAGTLKLNVGIALMAGGAALAAGGLLWHFLEPTGPRTAKWVPRPNVAPGYAGLALSGAF